MMRILCRTIGTFFCLIGIVGMLTPIPLGLIFFIIGLMFLIPSTPSAATAVRWARRKSDIFDRSMDAVTVRLPVPYRRALRQTEIDFYEI